MTHEIVTFPNGSHSIRPCSTAEAMHSNIGPWEEAQTLYIRQSGLKDRLRQEGRPLVIYDLGMGIAANALAAIECYFESNPLRDLLVLSFENDLGGLELALSRPECFDWIARNRDAVMTLLTSGLWETCRGDRRACWRLLEGDFQSQDLSVFPEADLVFFDFYSPKSNAALWGTRCFERLKARLAPGAGLLTYGASTAARSAMLLAGLYVGLGEPTGAKSQTTTAATALGDLRCPLPKSWLQKLARSSKPLPDDIDPSEHAKALERLRGHPQFSLF
jgi:queuine tRNA-ribosyltransferase